jgi:hypothetical protein
MHKKLRAIKKAKYRRLTIVFSLLILAGIGTYFLSGSHAATPYASYNADEGTLAGGATTQLCTGASDGNCVLFNADTTTSSDTAAGTPGITLGTGDEVDFNNASSAASQMAIMKADGVQWLRFDAFTDYPYDTEIKAAVSAGINVSVILQSPGTVTASAMGSWASTAAAHYVPMGVTTFEILNEPNGCESPNLTAAQYVPILQASYTAIKAVDSKATVITAGLCPNGGDNEPYTYLTAMYAAGAHGYFDAINDHAYSYPDTPLQTSDSWNPWAYLGQLHSIMAANGDGSKKIWITEFGCPSDGLANDCTDATEATQITDGFQQARSSTYSSYLGPLLIFNWWDSSDGQYGLFTSSGAAKPALAAYKQAAGAN